MKETDAEIYALLGLTLEQAMAEHDASADAEGDDKPGGRIKVTEVMDGDDGPEFERVAALPRRPIPDQNSPEVLKLAEFLTDRLSQPGEELYPGPLRPIQALMLKECWENRGLAAMVRVGGGKTLASGLLPTVLIPSLLPAGSKALIVTKSSMVPDCLRELAKMRRCWKMVAPHQLQVMKYEKLATPAAGEVLSDDGKQVVRKSLLARIAPKVLILDEAHCAGDAGSTTSKRIWKYVEENPDVIVVVMSGTFFKKSIKDGQRLLEMALRDRCPLPTDFEEREAWASHLDAKAVGRRVGVGALTRFIDEAGTRDEYETEEDYEVRRSITRRAVALRILETPGVIGTQDPPLAGVGLRIDHLFPDRESAEVEEAFVDLRGNLDDEEMCPPWRLPDGSFLPDAIQAAAKGYTLGQGFWNKPDPAPPDEYRFAKSQWNKWCGRMIRYNRKGIDSEARMKDCVRRRIVNDRYTLAEARLAGYEELAGESRLELWEGQDQKYREDTGLREPPTVGQWLSDECIEAVAKWVKEHRGVVWVDSIALGERLRDKLGIPYYHAGGKCTRTQRPIAQHQPGTPALASLKACGTGKNLQHIWSKNLWLCPPNEQALGRTHRDGQKAECVYNWIYLGCFEHLKAFFAAREVKAEFQQDMQLSPQKLKYADTHMPKQRELEARDLDNKQSRWARPFTPSKKLLDED